MENLACLPRFTFSEGSTNMNKPYKQSDLSLKFTTMIRVFLSMVSEVSLAIWEVIRFSIVSLLMETLLSPKSLDL